MPDSLDKMGEMSNEENGQKGSKPLTLKEHQALIKEQTKKPEFRLPFFVKLLLAAPVVLALGFFVLYFSLNNSAKAALDQGREDVAIKHYKTLLKINPKESEFYWNLAIAYFKKGQRVQALRQVKALEEIGEKELAEELERYFGRWK